MKCIELQSDTSIYKCLTMFATNIKSSSVFAFSFHLSRLWMFHLETINDPKTNRNWPIPRCTLIYLHGCSCNAAQYLEDGWELPWTGKDMWWDMVGRGTMGPCQVCGNLVATGFLVGYGLMWLSWLVIVGDARCTNCIVASCGIHGSHWWFVACGTNGPAARSVGRACGLCCRMQKSWGPGLWTADCLV